MDAILEAYSEDFPNRLKFERKRSRRDRDTVEELSIQWTNRLIGKARDARRQKVSFKIPDRYRAIRQSMEPRAQRQMPARPPGGRR